ncbi:uncharacterized protein LOC117327659 [Pecten maximus]|uniref:uncharacterized protein LOC117327659 n=1 Tax=Pecten maximus TaxID=6579 RepID=UPI00145899D5|nr:uncharacterized protein LOC117327659 [Pecten maximus]
MYFKILTFQRVKYFSKLFLYINFQVSNQQYALIEADQDGFTNVVPMCRSGTLTAGRVVVDTYDTGGLGHISCQCTVRLTVAHTIPVRFDINAYPDTVPASDCKSKLRFTRLPVNTFTEYQCQQISGDIITNFTINEVYNIALTRSDDNIPWQSGYCIFIKSDVTLNVTCDAPRGSDSSPSTSVTTTKTATTATTTTPTTTSITTGSSSIQTITNRTLGKGNGDVNNGELKESSIGVEIIAGAAGGGAVLLIVLIIVIVVIIRKKRSDAKNPEENFSVDIQPYAVATPKFYHDEGSDTLTQNSLYISAGPRVPDNNHIVTETGDMYAQVQKPATNENSETEHSNSSTRGHAVTAPSGDVYAVVNKPGKQSDDRNDESQTDEDRRPSRYKNQEGLVYAEIDDTSRPKSRPPVRPKPKPDADRVIYSEVNTDGGV